MNKSLYFSLTIALTGLIILHFLPASNYEEKTLKELDQGCEGKIETEGKIINTFRSEKGNRIGIIIEGEYKALTMLPEDKKIEENHVKIRGEASKYREQCFIFPDRIKTKK